MISVQLLSIPNVSAFLSTISFSEGTNSPEGYRMIFGSTKSHPILFDSFKDHPRKIQHINGLNSDAAGKYQIMSYTFDYLKRLLNLSDFSPLNQDLCACQLVDQVNALNDICCGRFEIAIQKACTIWASFPDLEKNGASHYGGQPSRSMAELRTVYLNSGGMIST